MARAYMHGPTIVVANLQYSGIVFGAPAGVSVFDGRIALSVLARHCHHRRRRHDVERARSRRKQPREKIMYTHLITARQLQALQAGGTPWMLFDCSFNLADPGEAEFLFLREHIAAAVRVDLDRDLTTFRPEDALNGGRHPLPKREIFAATMRRMGFGNGMQAVAYDRNGGGFSARLWWMLKWAGHDAVAVLDGGMQAWRAIAGPMEQGASREHPGGTFQLQPELRHWLPISDIQAHLQDGTQTLVDARSGERFRGETEPMDPVAGHIPGALNRPAFDNLQPNGHFKAPEELKKEFDALLQGHDPASVVHQCGSGVYATFNLLATEIAGYPPAPIYAGSFSEWCRTPDLPVATGA